MTAFSRALGCLLTNNDLRARLAEGAHQTSTRYSVERTTAQLLEYYQQLLEQIAKLEK
jgi:hypothetical protein